MASVGVNVMARKVGVRPKDGFTLIEVVAALAIMITLAAVAVPMAIKFMEVQEIRAAREEMSKIFNDILFGDPRNGTYGFVGDVGHYPKDLRELIANPSSGGYPESRTYTGGVQYGWSGPYSPDGENLLKDAWGEEYRYITDATHSEYAKIVSSGPNKTFDNGSGDDLIYPIEGTNIRCYGSLLVEVVDDRSSHVPSVASMRVFYSDNGVENYDDYPVTCSSANGYRCSHNFEGNHMHHGLHCVQILDGSNQVLSSTVASIVYGRQSKVTLILR